MNTSSSFLLFSIIAFSIGCSSQIKNARTVQLRIDGDCPMCEETIEQVGSMKGESEVDWVVETHMARVTFDSTRTDLDAILQRVAHAGYDTERFLAPKEAYDKLPGCCQYERTLMRPDVKSAEAAATGQEAPHNLMDQGPMTDTVAATAPLAPVFDAYFTLKDALVITDAKAGTSAAQELDKALAAVKMETLDHATHMVWMKVMGPLKEKAKAIVGAKDIDAQRKAFATLTDPLAQLAKAAPTATPIYLDHCPMYEGGADWLSKEKPIKNPFYGSMMMTCGSVKETIKE